MGRTTILYLWTNLQHNCTRNRQFICTLTWRHLLQGEFYLGTMPSTNGGSSSDAGVDDVDGHAIDPVRTQQAIDHLQQKIHKTMELIKAEQNAKEGMNSPRRRHK